MTTFALPVEALAAVHAVTVEQMLSALERAEQAGLVEQDEHGRWHATDRGRRLRRDSLLDLDVHEFEEKP